MAKLIKGKNDLGTCFPKVAKYWDYANNGGLTPFDVCAHSNLIANLLCPKCGFK